MRLTAGERHVGAPSGLRYPDTISKFVVTISLTSGISASFSVAFLREFEIRLGDLRGTGLIGFAIKTFQLMETENAKTRNDEANRWIPPFVSHVAIAGEFGCTRRSNRTTAYAEPRIPFSLVDYIDIPPTLATDAIE